MQRPGPALEIVQRGNGGWLGHGHGLGAEWGLDRVQLLRRDHRLLAQAHQLELRAHLGRELVPGLVQSGVGQQSGSARQVIGEPRRGLVGHRQQRLDARVRASGLHGGKHRVCAQLGEALAEGRGEAPAPGLVQDDLAHRHRGEARQGFAGALGLDVEAADALDGIAEQVDADRTVLGRRPDVEQAAAGGEFAAAEHAVHRLHAALGQPAHQGAQVHGISLGQLPDMGGDGFGRGDALQPGRKGGEYQAPRHRLAQQAAQRGKALADDGMVRAAAVIGQGLPGRETPKQIRRVVQEEAQLVGQLTVAAQVGTDEDRQRGSPGELGQMMGQPGGDRVHAALTHGRRIMPHPGRECHGIGRGKAVHWRHPLC